MESENQTNSAPATTTTPTAAAPAKSGAFNTPVAIILAALIIGGAIIIGLGGGKGNAANSGNSAAAAQQPAPAKVAVDSSKVHTAGEPFIGNPNAPVTLAFWTDYQCPFCKATEVGGIPQIPTPPAFPDIIKNYVDTGKVKIVFKDYPFLGNDSITGALYGRAVWNLYPKQYFAWRTAMFKAQDQEGDKGFGNAASIDKLDATIPGLDAAKIKADVAANTATYTKEINADKQEGIADGIQGTPGTIVGTQSIDGAQPYANFKAAIDAALASSTKQ